MNHIPGIFFLKNFSDILLYSCILLIGDRMVSRVVRKSFTHAFLRHSNTTRPSNSYCS